MVKDIRAGEIDIRAGEMDFHIHVVRGCGRINVQHRFVMRVVDEPADAICSDHARFGNLPLQVGSAGNGREVDMIRVMSEIGDRIEVSGARLRICDRFEDEGVIAGTSRHYTSGSRDKSVVAGTPDDNAARAVRGGGSDRGTTRCIQTDFNESPRCTVGVGEGPLGLQLLTVNASVSRRGVQINRCDSVVSQTR